VNVDLWFFHRKAFYNRRSGRKIHIENFLQLFGLDYHIFVLLVDGTLWIGRVGTANDLMIDTKSSLPSLPADKKPLWAL